MHLSLSWKLLSFVLGLTSSTINAFSIVGPSSFPSCRHRDPVAFSSSSRLSVSQNQITTTAAPAPPAVFIENLSCSNNGEVYQLRDVNYVLPRGKRIGLVGRNGCGKSTLLRILADASSCTDGATSPADEGVSYSGSVNFPRNIRVAFVEQEPITPSDVCVGDAILGVLSSSAYTASSASNDGDAVYDTVRRYRQAVKNAESDPDEFTAATTAMEGCNGWDVLTKADEIVTRLRVRHLQDMPLSALSGGERKRVALAAALVKEPDVLLMDEPTNHLDLPAIRWLSELLLNHQQSQQKPLTVLVVTHDRSFLEDVCTGIVELDQGSLYSYEGNYGAYLEGKEARFALQDAAVQSAKAKYRVELEWMRRQPQGRQSKAKSRIDAFYKLQKATKPRLKDPNLTIASGDNRYLGGKILTMKNVSLQFGDRVIVDDFSYEFSRGDKIGIVGGNGVGKSTFVRMLSGEQSIDEGTIETGETIVLGVYDQMGLRGVKDDQTIEDFVMERVNTRDGGSLAEAPADVRNLLRQFEFPRQRWRERISMLSGGEKRRLQLLSVLSKQPNFLILDEPSNDLDLNTITALESYLKDYNGVLMVVSHDRFFTDKVTKHLFVMEGNGIMKDYMGTLSEYAETLIELEAADTTTTTTVSPNLDNDRKKATHEEERQKKKAQNNMLRKMQKEMNKLESSMEKLKAKAAKIQEEIDSSADEGWTVLAELTEKLQSIIDTVEEQELQWLECAEVLEEAAE